MLNCSFKKTTDLCVCACELSRTHTHTELWGSPWGPDWEQGAIVAMAAAAPLLHHHSFSVFHCFYPFFLLLSSLLPADVFVSRCIQSFPQCFVKRSVRPQVANTQLRGVTLQGVCSVWDSCTETPSAANTSAWRESWVEAGCKAAGNSSWSNLYNPHLQMCWRPPADVGWKKQRRQQHSDPHPQTSTLGLVSSESWTPEQLLQEDKMIGYIQTDPSVQSQ